VTVNHKRQAVCPVSVHFILSLFERTAVGFLFPTRAWAFGLEWAELNAINELAGNGNRYLSDKVMAPCLVELVVRPIDM
jgi:hypothetical protein